MILTPAPLQKPALKTIALPSPRSAAPSPRSAAPAPLRTAVLRPVLHTARVPQQLCLDLQPRLR